MKRFLAGLTVGLIALGIAYAASPDFDSVLFKGSSSGTATLSALATAGTPAIKLPNTSGTVATGATSPIVLNATTGNVSCPTCGTGTGNVAGPGSSTSGHVATWNNTSGTLLADGGALATVATSGSAADLSAGTLAAARGGAGTINGALKGNGSGVVSQAACADLSNGATACSTATGTSGATIPLLNGANTWSKSQAGSITTLAISTATFTPDASNNHYKITLVHASCPCTLANPSPSFVAGTSGLIEVIQSSTGADTIGTWGSSYIAPGGTATIVLSAGANAIDAMAYFVIDSTHIMLIPSLNYSH